MVEAMDDCGFLVKNKVLGIAGGIPAPFGGHRGGGGSSGRIEVGNGILQ